MYFCSITNGSFGLGTLYHVSTVAVVFFMVTCVVPVIFVSIIQQFLDQRWSVTGLYCRELPLTNMMQMMPSSSQIILFLFLLQVAQIQGDCTRPSFSDIILSEKSVKDSYANGETAQLKCTIGYVPVDPAASKEVICTRNQWTKPQLECRMVRCPEPDVPHAEKVKGQLSPPYTYRNYIKYRCDVRYRMKGSETITCDVNGWNPGPPRCEEVICVAPDVKNAMQIGNQMESYQYISSIRFECNEGYILNGADTMICGFDGWSPSTVQCLKVICVAPDVKNARQIGNQMESYPYESSIRFECNEGYRLNGADTMICGFDGWSPSTVQCLDFDDAPSGSDVGREDPSGPHVGREDPSGPHVGREDPSGSHVGRKDPSGPHVGRKDSSGSHVGREDSSGSHVGRKDPSGPHVGRKDSSGSHVGRKDSSGSHVGREDSSGPHGDRGAPPGSPGYSLKSKAVMIAVIVLVFLLVCAAVCISIKFGVPLCIPLCLL